MPDEQTEDMVDVAIQEMVAAGQAITRIDPVTGETLVKLTDAGFAEARRLVLELAGERNDA